ncbi:hypothetical protein SDC9_76466 [bioreactor metagenome]|uniref:Uncharacterized protein n=1 Tax=bioreactor metagenome TaxID=1076179 RepID=A0A644YV70_9ZZZZ
MRAGIVNDQQVARFGLGQRTVHGELVVVFAECANHVVNVRQRLVFLAHHGDVVVSAVHRGPHEVAGAGVHADILLVRFLFMDRARHQIPERPRDIPSQLGEDADLQAGRLDNAVVFALHFLAHVADVRLLFVGAVRNADAAGKVDHGNHRACLFVELDSGFKELARQRRVVVVVGCVAS